MSPATAAACLRDARPYLPDPVYQDALDQIEIYASSQAYLECMQALRLKREDVLNAPVTPAEYAEAAAWLRRALGR